MTDSAAHHSDRRHESRLKPRYLRRARALAMQALYEWDVAGHNPPAALDGLTRFGEMAIDPADRDADEDRVPADIADRTLALAHDLISSVIDHVAQIDEKLALAAFHRPLDQMARVEKAILRLAICEILYNNAVPARVAINEAVELAKHYGGDHSGRFVNGVLGTIFSQAETATMSSLSPEREAT